MPISRQNNLHRSSRAGFTLIELILVMALLVIGAAVVAPDMASFFHGRVLHSEARRILSLIHYGQSRAVAEGVPVVLWLNPRDSTYGLSIQTGFVDNDDRASSFTLDAGLTLEIPQGDPAPVSELGDETLGLPAGQAIIRFLPTGFYDEMSVSKMIIHQGSDSALQLVQTANRISYEILPVAQTQG